MRIIPTITLLLFAFSPFLAQAQVSVGLKGGLTKAWQFYNTDLPDDAEITVTQMHFSAMAYYDLKSYLRIGVEPGFVQRGAACEPGWQPVFEGDTKLFLDCVELPVMISGHLPLDEGRLELFAKAGYGLSMVVRGRNQFILIGTDTSDDITLIPLGKGSRLNRWDTGFYGGAGVGAKIGPGNLIFESRFYAGLVDADRFNTSKNRSINYSLGYIFKL